MGEKEGFIKYKRETPASRSPKDRPNDYREVYHPINEEALNRQAARCMDCGVPFCHHGCPLGNIIPEFNDRVYNHEWEEAFHILRSTNNFPEFRSEERREGKDFSIR